ncbi:hypothetical protein [Moorena producens]
MRARARVRVQRSAVSGQWSVVSGQWSVVSCWPMAPQVACP